MNKTSMLISAILLLAMLLSACGGQSAGQPTSDKPTEIVMTFVTYGNEPQDLAVVEKAVSDYCLEKVNCTVKFKPVSIMEMGSKYTLWASSGENVDLMVLFQMDLGP